MATTVVPTTEEDPVLSVVRFTAELAWDDAGPGVPICLVAEPQVSRLCLEAEECMIMGRWLDVANLMLTSADVVASRVSAKDLECIFTVICNLVTRASSLDEALEMAKLISTKLIQQPNDKSSVRLKILFNLYNLLENPYSRFYVYMKALNLAASAKVTEGVISTFKKMDNLLKEWKIETLDQRDLFLAISNILKDNKSYSRDHFHFLSKYLATFFADDGHAMSEAKEEASQAIIEFIKAPDMFQCDLLDLPVIAQLERDEKYASIYQLLKIFLTQRLDAYLDFHTADSNAIKNYGLIHEDCVTKMRLMSLTDLASKGSGSIPYSLIKDTLHINDDDVENWVVKAITAKLLDCKMDQMNQTVIVSRCTERVFGLKQWQSLHSKLQVWRANIAKVVNTIQANKTSEEGGYMAQAVLTR